MDRGIKIGTCLIGKWLWCFPVEGIFLWRVVVEARFGLTHYGWRAYKSSCSYQVGL